MMNSDVKKAKLIHITTVPQSLDFLAGQVGYMKRNGFEVCALSSPGEFLDEFSEREEITVCTAKMARRISPLQDIVAILEIWRHMCKIRPQIVHAHTPKGGLLGTISARLANVPIVVYHIHGLPLETATGYKRFLLWLSEKVSCFLANQVYCVSQSIRKVAVAEGLCPSDKVKVLLKGSINGVDASGCFNKANLSKSLSQEMRSRYGIPEDALVIGFVGRVVGDKGIAELVQAWKILREEFSNLRLLIVGPWEPQDSISSDVEYVLKNDCRVHLTGEVRNPEVFYTAMDILSLPTYREGFGNVLVEAAAMELPTVATEIPGCVDSVQNGVTGTLVPARNFEALADAIREYIANPHLRYLHGKAGRDRVLRDFRPESIWKAQFQEYVGLLEANRLLDRETSEASVNYESQNRLKLGIRE